MMVEAGVDDAAFAALTAKIASDRGFGCAHYKPSCLRRRIAVRMRAVGVHDYASYASLLDRDRAEYDRLLDALTINVTKFFRNREVFDVLQARVLAPLLAQSTPVTLWSAGCSTGEEPYSLAIACLETAAAHGTSVARTRVVATDVDAGALARARAARYEARALDETPPDIIARWFDGAPEFSPTAPVRALVHFEQRDLLQQPAPATNVQVICCRNVMIYFDRASQDRLLHTFHDALAPDGILVLGKVESLIGLARGLFETVDARERIFRKAAA